LHQKIYEIITGQTSGILKADSNCFWTTPMEHASSLAIEIILLLAKKGQSSHSRLFQQLVLIKILDHVFWCYVKQNRDKHVDHYWHEVKLVLCFTHLTSVSYHNTGHCALHKNWFNQLISVGFLSTWLNMHVHVSNEWKII